jgi:hypothetical protein
MSTSVFAAVLASVLLAGCGNGATSSMTKAQKCFESHGFQVALKPDLGAAPIRPNTWLAAAKGKTDVDVAYFSSAADAKQARAQLVAVTKRGAATFGLKFPPGALNALVRTAGRVLFWWPRQKPTDAGVVRQCVA